MDVDQTMPASEILEVGDVAFPFVSAGAGEPLLFVNGSWADLRGWCGLWQDVAAEHRFMAYTHRHFGTAQWPQDKPFSRDVHTADLVAILRRLNEPVHLVGWSYSGGMVLGAAVQVPDLVRTVTVYEPSLSSILPDTLQLGFIGFRKGTTWPWLLPPSRGMPLSADFPPEEVSP